MLSSGKGAGTFVHKVVGGIHRRPLSLLRSGPETGKLHTALWMAKIGGDLFKVLTSSGLLLPEVLVNLKAGGQAIGGINMGKVPVRIRFFNYPRSRRVSEM